MEAEDAITARYAELGLGPPVLKGEAAALKMRLAARGALPPRPPRLAQADVPLPPRSHRLASTEAARVSLAPSEARAPGGDGCGDRAVIHV